MELELVFCTESQPSTSQLRRPIVKVGFAYRPRAICGLETEEQGSHIPLRLQSLEEQAAKECLDALTTAFEEKHLEVHETEVRCEKASALGIVLDGKMLETPGSGSSSSSIPIHQRDCPSKGTNVRSRARDFTRSLHLLGLGEEAVT